MLCSSIEDVVIGGKSCEAFSFCAPEIHFDLSTRSDSCRWMTHGRVDSTGNYYRSYWNRIPNPGLYDWICAFLVRNLRPQYPRFEFSAQFLALIKPQYGPSFPATPRQGPSFFPRLLGFNQKTLWWHLFRVCEHYEVPYLAEFRRNLLATDDWMDETRQFLSKSAKAAELPHIAETPC